MFEFEADLNSGADDSQVIYRAAILCAQLPRDSRTMRAISPALAWSDESYLLARCEYMLRIIAWMFSEDGSKGINKPEPIATPAQIATTTAMVEATDFGFVDDILGIGGDDGGPQG